MVTIEVAATGQELSLKNPVPKLIARSKNLYYVKFTLPEDLYTGTITAHFMTTINKVSVDVPVVLNAERIIQVPSGANDVVVFPNFSIALSVMDETNNISFGTTSVTVQVSGSGVPDGILPLPDNTVHQYDDFNRKYNEIIGAISPQSSGIIADKSIELSKLSDALKSKVNNNILSGNDFQWTIGGLSASTGLPASSTTRLRSQYIYVNGSLDISLTDYSLMHFYVNKYNPSTKTMTFSGSYVESGSYSINDECIIRIVIAYKDNRTISNTSLSSNVNINTNYASKGQLESVRKYKFITDSYGYEIEIGSISTTDGSKVTSTNKVRTTDYIHVFPGDSIGLNDDNISSDNFNFNVIYYDTAVNKPYVSNSGFVASNIPITQERYIKLIISYTSNAAVSDVNNFKNVVRVYKTLAVNEAYQANKNLTNSGIKKTDSMIDKLYTPYKLTTSDAFSITSLTPTMLPFNTDFIYGKYDALVTAHPEYVSRVLLGNNSAGLPIYEYVFEPYKIPEIQSMYEGGYVTGNIKTPKIIITTGIHGSEQTSIFSWYSLFNLICNSWETNKLLETLRFNVKFIVIPVVNPSGVNAYIRNNPNGIDLNRNFPTSELEHQYLLNVFNDNQDADFYIDGHQCVPTLSTIDNLDAYVMFNFASGNQRIKNLCANVTSVMDRLLRSQYANVKTACEAYYQANNKSYPLAFVTPEDVPLMDIVTYVGLTGHKSLLIELERDNVFNSNTSNDAFTLNCAVQLLVNMIYSLYLNI